MLYEIGSVDPRRSEEPMTGEPISTSNCQKFRTVNPISRLLIGRFYSRLATIVRQLQPASVLDAGCGEGETIFRLRPLLPDDVLGCDANPECVRFASERFDEFHFSVKDIYDLPYATGQFDLVLCLEVLEHLERPQQALEQLWRVTKKHLIVSVPQEPFFRFGNFLRGKYLGTLGNHPEHIQHWNRRRFRQFLAQRVDQVEVHSCGPWLIAHGRKE